MFTKIVKWFKYRKKNKMREEFEKERASRCCHPVANKLPTGKPKKPQYVYQKNEDFSCTASASSKNDDGLDLVEAALIGAAVENMLDNSAPGSCSSSDDSITSGDGDFGGGGASSSWGD